MSLAMAPSGGQGARSPYQGDSEYADYGANGQDQFVMSQKGGPRGQGFDPRQMQGFEPRPRGGGFGGSYYNEEQAHFGPPGTGPVPGDPYFPDDRYYSGPGGAPAPRGGRGSAMMMQDNWYRGAAGSSGGGIPSEFEDDGYGVTSFSDEDADELDLR